MKKYCVIVTTFSSDKTGSGIIHALLNEELAACVQVLPIKSFYKWKGKLSTGREKLMLIKAKTRDFGRIKRTIIENHDYQTPEIISLRIENGSAAYFKWMDEVIK